MIRLSLLVLQLRTHQITLALMLRCYHHVYGFLGILKIKLIVLLLCLIWSSLSLLFSSFLLVAGVESVFDCFSGASNLWQHRWSNRLWNIRNFTLNFGIKVVLSLLWSTKDFLLQLNLFLSVVFSVLYAHGRRDGVELISHGLGVLLVFGCDRSCQIV